jgi:hypothetical protein
VNAIDIQGFKLERNYRGFHYVDPADFQPFIEWLRIEYKPGKHGDPCYPEFVNKTKRSEKCK